MASERITEGGRLGAPSGGVPVHFQLSTLFRRRIACGEWAVGAQIPTLEALVKESGAAPATVRKALDALAEEALIARYRARGTFVLRRPAESLWQEIGTDGAGFLRARNGPEIKLLSSEYVAAPPAVFHEGTLAEGYLYLRRCYWREGQPFMFNNLYLDAALAERLPLDVLASRPVAEMLAEAGAEAPTCHLQTLTIAAADVEVARQLHIPLNAPIARIDRTRLSAEGRTLMASTSFYRGDVVRLDFREDDC